MDKIHKMATVLTAP